MKFKKFSLTEESLESKQALEDLFQKQMAAGTLSCKALEVFALEPFKSRIFNDYSETFVVAHQGWFSHNVVSRCLTIWEKWRFHRENKKLLASKEQRAS